MKAFVGEGIGTFVLTLFGCGSVAVAILFGEYSGIFQVGLIWGTAVTLAIYLTRYLSCAHLNIIRRAAQLFDKVVVCIMVNSTKTSPMFSIEERADMVRRTVGKYPNVTVDTSDGLLAEYARQFEGAVVVKGLRAASAAQAC